eukprot:TRINITY_DN1748_c0_g1_i1.p1 TRINITY_DN1748_c0_g1~~TRINITY_DN1748_c0_g1_i1.p1  ORF type:complete len:612 (-),score=69.91 TRINITY_DN1748_c0_g1_i1:176-2011(-)
MQRVCGLYYSLRAVRAASVLKDAVFKIESQFYNQHTQSIPYQKRSFYLQSCMRQDNQEATTNLENDLQDQKSNSGIVNSDDKDSNSEDEINAKENDCENVLEFEMEGEEANGNEQSAQQNDDLQIQASENVVTLNADEIRRKLKNIRTVKELKELVDQQVAGFDVDCWRKAIVLLARLIPTKVDMPTRNGILSLVEMSISQDRDFDVTLLVKQDNVVHINFVWALTKINQQFGLFRKNPSLVDTLRQLILSAAASSQKLSSHQAVTLLWVMIKTGAVESNSIMTVIKRLKDYKTFKPTELGMSFWAILKSGNYDAEVLDTLLDQAVIMMNILTDNDIGTVCACLKEYRHYHAAFFEAVKVKIRQGRLRFYSSEKMLPVAAAFAEFGLSKDAQCNSSFTACAKMYPVQDPEHVTKLLLQFSLLEVPVSDAQLIFDNWNRNTQRNAPQAQMQKHHCSTLKQAQDIYGSRGEKLAIPEPVIKEGLQFDLDRVERGKDRFSRVQSEIARVLEYQGLDFQMKIREENAGMEVGLGVFNTAKEEKIAVQVTSPAQYSINTPYRLLGTNIAYMKQLENYGWKIVNISMHELQDVRDWEKKVQFVKSKMKQHYECYPFY